MKILLPIFLILFINCKNPVKQKYIESGSINQIGLYHTKKYKIHVKEFTNGTITYLITDKKNNLLFQHNGVKSFSKHQFWCMFWDKENKLWVHNSDYNITKVCYFDMIKQKFIEKDISDIKFELPNEFKDKLNR